MRQRCFTAPAPVIIGMRDFFWRSSRGGLLAWYCVMMAVICLLVAAYTARDLDLQVVYVAVNVVLVAVGVLIGGMARFRQELARV